MVCQTAASRSRSTASEAAECAGALRLLIWLDAPRLRSAAEDQMSTEAEPRTVQETNTLQCSDLSNHRVDPPARSPRCSCRATSAGAIRFRQVVEVTPSHAGLNRHYANLALIRS